MVQMLSMEQIQLGRVILAVLLPYGALFEVQPFCHLVPILNGQNIPLSVHYIIIHNPL